MVDLLEPPIIKEPPTKPLKPVPSVPVSRINETKPNQPQETKDSFKVRVQEAFDYLSTKPETFEFLIWYSEGQEIQDEALLVLQKAFSELEGANLVPEVVNTNLSKQAGEYLIAAREIVEHGKATVSCFGVYKTFHSLEELQESMQKVRDDFDKVASLPPTLAALKEQGLAIIDKYLFDGRNLEAVEDEEVNTLVLEPPNYPLLTKLFQDGKISKTDYQVALAQEPVHQQLIDLLKLEGITSTNEPEVETLPFLPNPLREIKEDKAQSLEEYRNNHQILKPGPNMPDVVILNIPNKTSINENHYAYQQVLLDYWMNFAPNQRPIIIMYTNNFNPSLEIKSAYKGFLFASNPDELRNIMAVTKELTALKKQKTHKPRELSPFQEQQYDASTDLREWENITADTYQSLKHILKRFRERLKLYNERNQQRYTRLFESTNGTTAVWNTGEEDFTSQDKSICPQRSIKTILDCGGGQGRIGGMLARLGYKVIDLDISQEQLNIGRTRIKEEGEGLRGETERPGLSYHALKRLEKEVVLPQPPILDDEKVSQNFLTVKGNFYRLESDLSEALIEWQKRFPSIDPYDFFNTDRSNGYAFSDQRDIFGDVGFDVAMFNWHTFFEIGDPSNQRYVLMQLMDVLWPGGELIIENADRLTEPYASAIKVYHESHPDEPYGTHRDKKEDGTEYSPRYFPDRNELVLLLQSVGFEIDPGKDIQTYLITNKDPVTGKEKLEVKELFITARKPKR